LWSVYANRTALTCGTDLCGVCMSTVQH